MSLCAIEPIPLLVLLLILLLVLRVLLILCWSEGGYSLRGRSRWKRIVIDISIHI